MRRTLGALVVLGLIGGAVWIGIASGKREIVVGFSPGSEVFTTRGEDIECPPNEMRGDTEASSFISDPPGYPSLEEAVRKTLQGVLASDELRIKGNEVDIVRDGYTVAIVALKRADSGQWIVSTTESCVSARIFDRHQPARAPTDYRKARAAILEAAEDRDYEGLRQILEPETFLSDFGYGLDPIKHWAGMGDEPLELMAALLRDEACEVPQQPGKDLPLARLRRRDQVVR